jgi:hypothetical protein
MQSVRVAIKGETETGEHDVNKKDLRGLPEIRSKALLAEPASGRCPGEGGWHPLMIVCA